MVWVNNNNNSWDQEHFYGEARQMMREQRAYQREQEYRKKSGSDALATILSIVSFWVVFGLVLYFVQDAILGFALGVFAVLGVMWLSVLNDNREEKSDKLDKEKRANRNKSETKIAQRQKEEYHDDTI